MITVISGLFNIFIDSGLKSGLIQGKDVTSVDYSSVFWFNFIVSSSLALLLCLLSRPIADFYEEPKLVSLIYFYAPSLVISALAIVQQARFTRELNFKVLTLISMGSLLVSGIVSITMAYNGYGVYSLVVQILLTQTIITFLSFTFSAWFPAFVMSKESFKKYWKYSSYMLGNKLLVEFTSKMDIIIIGKYMDKSTLGLYSKAKNLNQLPSSLASGIISKSLFPIFSKYQDNPEYLFKIFLKISKILTIIFIPLFALLYLVSPELIVLLYTDKWIGAVYYFKLFCLAGFFYPISVLSVNLINALGRSDLFFKAYLVLTILKGLVYLVIAFVLQEVKAEYFIGVYIALMYIDYFINLYLLKKAIGQNTYKAINYLLLPALVSVIGIGVSTYLISITAVSSLFLIFAYKIVVFTVIWVSAFLIFYQESVTEILSLIKNKS